MSNFVRLLGVVCLVTVIGAGGWWGYGAITSIGDASATIGMCGKDSGEKAQTCKENAKDDPKSPETVTRAINEPN